VALLGAEAPDTPALADADLLHQAPGPDLAHTRQRLQQGQHLHLPDDLVAVGLVEQLLEAGRAHLQLLPQLGSTAASGGGLLERGLTLIRRERGRERHVRTLPRWLPASTGRNRAFSSRLGSSPPARRRRRRGRRRRSPPGPPPACRRPPPALPAGWRCEPGRECRRRRDGSRERRRAAWA